MAYNGWTNYETWNIMLHIDNDEWSYDAKFNFLKRRLSVDEWEAKEFACGLFPEGTCDMSRDEMENVNWEEVAEHWTEEIAEIG